jgi:glycosyltransferase involved in cell wall biosynthesis
VFVVPIRIGGGTRIKIFEAMASGTPVVSTTVGAEGLPVVHQRHLLNADTAEDFARAVVTVLQDHHLAADLAEQAKRFVSENYDWARISDQFAEVCSQTIRKKQGTFS